MLMLAETRHMDFMFLLVSDRLETEVPSDPQRWVLAISFWSNRRYRCTTRIYSQIQSGMHAFERFLASLKIY